ncbi:flagellar type III secretion system protein FlhB [Burkholderia ubonensis]|uniref:flagellar type III secretion system protein FlhB n=1 Tax=Burkholderia ubonensis TaxID=101571 RepID=UPI000751B889|nr:flagellar type III secretion system protein FlhB [Burkholderia ubonensis]KWB79399.1 flagellar biosynthetic protein FlhB [Burkholderia ubonensis]
MADQQSGDKTEQASGRKLDKARDAGQVPRSRDMAAAIGMLASLKVLTLFAPLWLAEFRTLFALCVTNPGGNSSKLSSATFILLAKMIAPLAIVPLSIVFGSLIPGGWVVSFERLMPSLGRLNPVANLKQYFSARHLAQTGVAVLKAAALGVALWFVVRSTTHAFVQLQSETLNEAIAGSVGQLLDATLALVAVAVSFGLIDVPIQHFLFLRGQRMTKQEVKDEYKDTEGNPEIRGRIKRRQREIAQRAIRKTVPQADVVIANPTHYAVALKYDAKRADAPFVVAKGIDEMALYIRAVADEHGIHVMVLPPLARAIYRTSQVNQQIPAALYRAVAQVLTYVLQLKAFQSGRRATRPVQPSDLGLPDDFLSPPKR